MTIYRRRKAAAQTENAANVTGASATMMRADRDAQRANFRETSAKLAENW
jgi:hypothetical protein